MVDEKWQQVKAVFSAALLLTPPEREKFVRENCESRPDLFEEVSSLLKMHEQAEVFLEKPAVAEISGNMDSSQESFATGKSLNSGELIALLEAGGEKKYSNEVRKNENPENEKTTGDEPIQSSGFWGNSSMMSADTILQNRYRIIRLLGQGGMGAVYLAVDQRLGHQVALKQMFHAQQEILAQAFEREAKILARLHHRGLPKVSDHFSESDYRYLVMQYIGGRDLGEILETSRQPLPVGQILTWADSLLEVLEYLHGHQPPILHRDIKPQNLKISETGELFLLDFGLAKDTPNSHSRSHLPSVIGYSFNYSPLEQINGEKTTPETDIYAFCATLYHLLTNKLPADSLSRLMAKADGVTDPLIPANQINPQVSAELAAVLQRGIELRREQRLSAPQLRQLLKNLRATGPVDQTGKPRQSNGAVPPLLPSVPVVGSISNSRMPDKLVKVTDPVPGTTATGLAATNRIDTTFKSGRKIFVIGGVAAAFLILSFTVTIILINLNPFKPSASPAQPAATSSPVTGAQVTPILTPTVETLSSPLPQNTDNQNVKKPADRVVRQTPPLKTDTPTPKTSGSKTVKTPIVRPTILPQ